MMPAILQTTGTGFEDAIPVAIMCILSQGAIYFLLFTFDPDIITYTEDMITQ